MPPRIDRIDAIARKLQRDVLFVIFHTPHAEMTEGQHHRFKMDTRIDWELCTVRQDMSDWLDAQEIAWRTCAGFASTNTVVSYLGKIYIDAHYEPELPRYQTVAQFMEFSDGGVRYRHSTFCHSVKR